MNQKEFTITITPEGRVEVHIQGYKGAAACRSAAALMEKIVGHIESSRETSEAYEPEETVRVDRHH
ncbi:MAG: DUF2997 domain-containing protein [Verrucomicrobiaceae bacterium]|nr:MAG: DUF2997 domain-containing protein [Verrucomicrobiaceae bacterium]